MQAYKKGKVLFAVVLVGVLVSGTFLIVFFSLNFESARKFADLLAKDGSAAPFTPARFAAFSFFRLIGLALILAALGGWLARKRIIARLALTIQWAQFEQRELRLDMRAFYASLRLQPGEKFWWWLILLLMLLSVVNKAVLLNKPLNHDEAYTFIAFASQPFSGLIADYHLPNNHIFHTILVYLAFHLLGNEPWIVRLPALLAGILLIPATYLATRAWFGRLPGILAAGLVAVLPVIRFYATRARGYSMIMLGTVLLIYLASRGLREKNRFIWLLFIMTAGLGFYTIPIMLYPFGIVFTWLALSWLVGDISPDYKKSFWKYLLSAGVLTVVLTVLLYLPVVKHSGLRSLTGNTFVSSLDWGEFIGNVLPRLELAWTEWREGIPGWWSYFLAMGVALSLVFHFRLARHRLPLPVAIALWMGGILAFQRVAPEARVWIFALPFTLILAAGGTAGFIEWAQLRSPLPSHLYAGCLTAIMVGVTLSSGFQTYQGYQNRKEGGDTQSAVYYIKDKIGNEDIIFSDVPEGPIVWYYASYYGIDRKHYIQIENADFKYAWVLLPTIYGESLSQVVAAQKPIEKALNMSMAELVHRVGSVEIYRIPRLAR